MLTRQRDGSWGCDEHNADPPSRDGGRPASLYGLLMRAYYLSTL